MKKSLKQRGFTLIELMIVVAIIGILAAVAIPAFMDYMKKGKKVEASLQLKNISTAVKTYFTEKSLMPPSSTSSLPGADGGACANTTTDPVGKFPVVSFAADPAWGAMGFAVTAPALFTYHWTKGTTTNVATAVGDIDCDTTLVTYSLIITNASGQLTEKMTEPTAD